MLGSEVTPRAVTSTSGLPAPLGDRTVSTVSDTQTRLVAKDPPKVTDVAPDSPVPWIVTKVPPALSPSGGSSERITGPR